MKIKLILFFICVFQINLYSNNSESIQLSSIASDSCYSNIDYSLECANKALKLAKNNNDTTELMLSNYVLGIVYHLKEEYNIAYYFYNQSLVFSKSLNNHEYSGKTYNNIASLLNEQNFRELSIKHLLLAEKYGKLANDTLGLLYTYNNLGNNYAGIENYFESNIYFKKAINLVNSNIHFNKEKASIKYNIGYNYYLQDKLNLAEENYNNSLIFFKSIDDKYWIISNYNRLAELYLIKNELNVSNLYIDSSLSINYYDNLTILNETYFLAYQINSNLNNYKKALNYLEKSNNLNDSIENEDFKQQIIDLKERYRHKELIVENKLKTLELNKQKVATYVIILVLTMSIILLVILMKKIKQKNIFNNKLNEKNKIITEQNTEINESIDYASHILNKALEKNKFPDFINEKSFIWLNNLSKVGGDFYRVFSNSKECLIAVADCTGHGVAGGFLATLSNQFLERSIDKDNLHNLQLIFYKLNMFFINYFKNNDEEITESLNLSLLYINSENLINFASNRQSIFVITNNKIEEYKGERKFIGLKEFEDFKVHSYNLNNNAKIVLCSDGYYDQLNEINIRLGKSKFKEILKNIPHSDKEKIIFYLKSELEHFKNSKPQTDDILVSIIEI